VNEYQDISIDTIDHRGCMGAFVMSRPDGSSFAIPFVYDGKTKQLSMHPDYLSEAAAFNTTFHAEVREAWLAHRDTLRSMH
jgi:hypothetical protein